jgi:CRP-like cAMP-binding protein
MDQTPVDQTSVDRWGNRLLDALPEETSLLLKPHISRVLMRQGQMCVAVGQPVDHVYFPETGLIALAICTTTGQLVYTSVIGRHGAVGLQRAFGERRSLTRGFVLVTGWFYKVPAKELGVAFAMSEEARALVSRYIETRLVEANQYIACSVLHNGAARLARWLLLISDRIGSDRLPLTQNSIGKLIGIARTNVPALARQLKDGRTIRYTRGSITIINRKALKAAACECYDVVQRLYEGLSTPSVHRHDIRQSSE